MSFNVGDWVVADSLNNITCYTMSAQKFLRDNYLSQKPYKVLEMSPAGVVKIEVANPVPGTLYAFYDFHLALHAASAVPIVVQHRAHTLQSATAVAKPWRAEDCGTTMTDEQRKLVETRIALRKKLYGRVS